jgi:hypothetical protein
LDIICALYYHGESKPNDDKNDYHINRVKVKEEDEEEEDREDGDVELVEHVDQYIAHPASEFEVVSEDDQYIYNDLANHYRHSSLLVNELESKKKTKNNFEYIIAIKIMTYKKIIIVQGLSFN